MNLYFNLSKTFEQVALAFQAYATLVTIGLLKNKLVLFGPQYWINLPSQNMQGAISSDAKYISPDANFDSLFEFTKLLESQAAEYAGLAVEAYRKTTTATSGYQMLLAMLSVITFNKLQIPFYQRGIKLLIQLMIDIYNILSNLYVINSNKVSVVIDLPSVKINEMDRILQWLKLLNLGITTKLNIIKQKYPEITQLLIDIILQNNIQKESVQLTQGV